MLDKIPVERSRGLRIWVFYPACLTCFYKTAAQFYAFHHSHLSAFFLKRLCLYLLFPPTASGQTCPPPPCVDKKLYDRIALILSYGGWYTGSKCLTMRISPIWQFGQRDRSMPVISKIASKRSNGFSSLFAAFKSRRHHSRFFFLLRLLNKP